MHVLLPWLPSLESFSCLLSNHICRILEEKFGGENLDSGEPEASGAPGGRAIWLLLSAFLFDDVRLSPAFQTPEIRNVHGLLSDTPQRQHKQLGFVFVHRLRTKHRFFWGLETPLRRALCRPEQVRAPAKNRTLQIAPWPGRRNSFVQGPRLNPNYSHCADGRFQVASPCRRVVASMPGSLV